MRGYEKEIRERNQRGPCHVLDERSLYIPVPGRLSVTTRGIRMTENNLCAFSFPSPLIFFSFISHLSFYLFSFQRLESAFFVSEGSQDAVHHHHPSLLKFQFRPNYHTVRFGTHSLSLSFSHFGASFILILRSIDYRLLCVYRRDLCWSNACAVRRSCPPNVAENLDRQ